MLIQAIADDDIDEEDEDEEDDDDDDDEEEEEEDDEEEEVVAEDDEKRKAEIAAEDEIKLVNASVLLDGMIKTCHGDFKLLTAKLQSLFDAGQADKYFVRYMS